MGDRKMTIDRHIDTERKSWSRKRGGKGQGEVGGTRCVEVKKVN